MEPSFFSHAKQTLVLPYEDLLFIIIKNVMNILPAGSTDFLPVFQSSSKSLIAYFMSYSSS